MNNLIGIENKMKNLNLYIKQREKNNGLDPKTQNFGKTVCLKPALGQSTTYTYKNFLEQN